MSGNDLTPKYIGINDSVPKYFRPDSVAFNAKGKVPLHDTDKKHVAVRSTIPPAAETRARFIKQASTDSLFANKLSRLAASCHDGGPGTICHDIFKFADSTVKAKKPK